MKEYIITRKPKNLDWDMIPKLSIDTPLFAGDEVFIRAFGQICYDNDALYVRLSCDEKEIRAELNGLLDEVCNDSCMEFFFCPMEGDKRYFNIESNLNGAIFLGFGTNVHTLVRLIPEEPSIKPVAKKTVEGWELSYSIPFEFIRRFFPDFSPKSGKHIRANCFKCGDMTSRPHYYTWNETPPLPNASFHNPDGFGKMIFE